GTETKTYEGLGAAFLSEDVQEATEVLARSSARLRTIVASSGPDLAGVFTSRLTKDIPLKFARMRKIQSEVGMLPEGDLLDNVEGAVRAAFYMAVRARYNAARLADEWGPFRTADFFFLREFSY